jgi:hypothetical protein
VHKQIDTTSQSLIGSADWFKLLQEKGCPKWIQR